jgi:hypothetical protein
VRRWPRLRFFSSLGKAQEVAALLHAGASVDLLDEAGASALLCAIQHAEQTGDRQVLDLLLQKKHDQATLDSVTAKKQLTLLFCAIDYGESDVVEKVLRMGAGADRRGNMADVTPLYHVIGTLASVRYPHKLNRFLHDSIKADPDLMQQETLRRYGVSVTGVFGDRLALGAIVESARHKEIFEKLITDLVKERVARHTIPKLIRIAELLLENGINPNAQHRSPAPGRRPLMLAAENNSALAFDLMMRYRGNPYQTDAAGRSCMQIAMGFERLRVADYLHSNESCDVHRREYAESESTELR